MTLLPESLWLYVTLISNEEATMRVLKLTALSLILIPLALASANPTAAAPCAPNGRQLQPLHIAWIHCQNNYDEVVVIVNASGEDIDLAGYQLDSLVGQKFVFQPSEWNPNCCVIQAYGTLRIHSGPRNLEPFDDPRDLHWLNADGQPRRDLVWRDSYDVATLFNAQKQIVAHYEYGQP